MSTASNDNSKETVKFVDKVLKFKKADDGTKVASFLEVAQRNWAKQVQLYEKKVANITQEIKELKENKATDIKDAKAVLEEAYLNIDLDAKTREEREDYLVSYEDAIATAYEHVQEIELEADCAIEAKEEELKDTKETLKFYKANLEAIQ